MDEVVDRSEVSGRLVGDVADSVEALLRRNRRLAILGQITRRITVNMSYDEIIREFAAPLRDVIPYDLLSFCLLEEGRLVIKSGVPRDQGTLGIGTAMGRDFFIPWRALLDKRVWLRTDIPSDGYEGKEDQLLAQLGIRSAVVAPLLVNNEAIGTLNLGYREPYTDADGVYVQQLADQLAVCLQNSRHYRDLLEAEREWGRTFHAVQDLLVVVDREGTVLRANHPYEGLETDELAGRKCSDVFGFCTDDSIDPVAEAFRSGRDATIEWKDPDGGRILCVRVYPVPDETLGVARVVLSVRDVTTERKMEGQLFQSAKLAALGEMAAGVAHELNSPLTAVIGNAGLLLRRTGPEERSYKMLEDIRVCGRRCRRIIQGMLTFARQDDHDFEPVHLSEVVEGAIDLVGYQLKKDGVELRIEAGEVLPSAVGNAQQIEQVVVNLLLNARDAVRTSVEKKVSVRTDFEVLEGGELGVAVVVSDTGVGLTPEHEGRVFDPFFTTKGALRGTGLGLSVSMGIAKAHGGTIAVQAAPGAGCTFTLVLPQLAGQFMERVDQKGSEPLGGGRPLPLEVVARARPLVQLARSLGRLLAHLGPSARTLVEVECPQVHPRLLVAAVLEGLLSEEAQEEGVNLVNGFSVARRRGVRVVEVPRGPWDDDVPRIRATVQGGGRVTSVVGAMFGRHEARIVEIDGVPVEALPEGNLVVCWAHERPGLLGGIASILADHDVHIGQMRSGRDDATGRAVAVFNVDHPVTGDVREQLLARCDLIGVSSVTL